VPPLVCVSPPARWRGQGITAFIRFRSRSRSRFRFRFRFRFRNDRTRIRGHVRYRARGQRASTGACRARHCAATTLRQRGTIHTMALPGNPRAERSSASVPVRKEAVAREISVVAVLPISPLATTLIRDAGPPQADQKVGAPGRTGIPHRLPRPRSLGSAIPDCCVSEGGASPTLRRRRRTRRPGRGTPLRGANFHRVRRSFQPSSSHRSLERSAHHQETLRLARRHSLAQGDMFGDGPRSLRMTCHSRPPSFLG